jgi:hypothetical protein
MEKIELETFSRVFAANDLMIMAAIQERVDVFVITTGSARDRPTHLEILADLSRMFLKTDGIQNARAANYGLK